MARTIKVSVLKAGLETRIVDLGRSSMMDMAVPVGGALDKDEAAAANFFVANVDEEPVLEICMFGPELLFEDDCCIAICGADISPQVDGQDIPMNQYQRISKGQKLSFGRLKHGCRAYLAIKGRWISQARKNGLPLPALKKGDLIRVKADLGAGPSLSMEKSVFPSHRSIRIYPGPEFGQFRREYLAFFFSRTWTISPQSNRMGYRLEGGEVPQPGIREIISSPILPGTIQVTGSGQPVVLLADAQTTGGYPRLGVVASEQINAFGQLKPGDSLDFVFEPFPVPSTSQ